MGNDKKPAPAPKTPGSGGQTPAGSKPGTGGNNKPAGSTTQRPPQR